MRDNEQIGDCDISDRAWEIVDRHGLGLRADRPQAAAFFALTGAAEILREASLTSTRDQAVSPDVEHRARDVLSMVADALSSAVLCPCGPVPGILPELADGTLQGSGAGVTAPTNG